MLVGIISCNKLLQLKCFLSNFLKHSDVVFILNKLGFRFSHQAKQIVVCYERYCGPCFSVFIYLIAINDCHGLSENEIIFKSFERFSRGSENSLDNKRPFLFRLQLNKAHNNRHYICKIRILDLVKGRNDAQRRI